MSEPIAIPNAPQTSCAACHQPLGQEHYQFANRAICLNCAQQIYAMEQRNSFAAGPWFLGLLVGIVVALASGAAWAAIAISSGLVIGFVAVGIGFVVGTAVVKAMGGRRGRSVQVITIGCAILGIFAGKGFLVGWAQSGTSDFEKLDTVGRGIFLLLSFVAGPFIAFRAFDVLWYLLAIRAAWQIGKAPAAKLHGPYSTPISQPAQPMQFDVVEPMTPPNQSQAQP